MGRNRRIEYLSLSAEETLSLGKSIGKQLKPPKILCFFGDLGAGKTTLIKGIVEAATGCSAEEVNSPTFVTLNLYAGPKTTAYHFDLYRLKGAEEFLAMGFDEYLGREGITLIEWSERIPSLLPPDCIRIELSHVAEETRKVSYDKF